MSTLGTDSRVSLDALDFDKGGGLLPAIVQHADTGTVLMLGYMNREALAATLARRRVVFFSRSRQRLWEKGETSGHVLELGAVHADCDADALLVSAWPRGPVCHLGRLSCFGDDAGSEAEPLAFLGTLAALVRERLSSRPAGSYTAQLAQSGVRRIAQKVGEEGLETALAGAAGTDEELIGESADLLYHLLVLLETRGVSLARVTAELQARHTARARTR
jgi:phosphoribosyl-AMP cyclohydrolase / phosphoribosyl-ATP pyrophosphohydrolase